VSFVKLLLAHGDAAARDVLRDLARDLLRLGFEPVESGEGLHTISLLLAADAPPLAVVDWDLPGCSGPELCRRVRAQRRRRPPYIILLAPTEEQIGEALEAGADDCLPTAAGGHELQARIVAARRLAALS
jgi:DNA-binding response OmpR family regulator